MSSEHAPWHKSTYSGSAGNCVEVSEGAATLVRDTEHRGLGHLAYPSAAWSAFLGPLKNASA
ncbi:DUF397 domain-containing protein [Nocardiopsis sp. NPDC006198]|uniref:DUF397 domain-containing protein n=1 Tax=Nocardiopsis sp. NPDC006198 TaxID=3154472 RepID=UPI00339DDC25